MLKHTEGRREGKTEERREGFLTPEAVQVETLSVTHAQGFPLLLKDAASSYWPSLENEQCTAA